MNIATAYVEVRTQRQKAEKDAKDSATSMMKQMTDVFKAGIYIAGIQKSIQDASNLNETISKTKVIFGGSSDEITRWAENSAQAFGLSRQAALDAASTFAVFGKGAGLAGSDLTGFSEKLVSLSSDLASFYNTSPEQAIMAIGAALRGESEPIRAYGVLLDDATLKQQAMTMGLYDGKGALDQHARVLAAQAVILQQTSDAQGDFARTSDGLANQQRIAAAEAKNASAELGQSLLPAYQKLVKVVMEAIKTFGDLPAPVQTAVVALAGLAFLSGPLGSMVKVVKDIRDTLIKVGVSSSGLAAGFALLTVAAVGLSLRSMEVAKSNRAMEQSFKDLSSATDEELMARFTLALGAAAIAGEGGADAIKAFAEANLQGAQRVLEHIRALEEQGLASEGQIETEKLLTTAINDESKARQQARETENLKTDAEKAEAEASRFAADMLSRKSKEVRDEEAALKTASKAVTAFSKDMLEDRDALVKAGRAAYDNQVAIEDLEFAWKSLTGAIDADEALLRLQGQFDDVHTSAVDAWTAAQQGADDTEEKVRSAALDVDALKHQVIDYGKEVLGLPPEKVTEMLAEIDQGKLDEVEAELEKLARERLVRFTPVKQGDLGYTKLALGGPVKAHQRYIVGEDGPELFESAVAGRISPHGQIGSALASSAAVSSPSRSSSGPIILVIEGQPFRAMLASHDQSLFYDITAGAR